MKKYKITYTQSRNGEHETTIYRGYDADHAVERFLDSMEEEGGSQGIEIVSVSQVIIKDGIVLLA
jgi:hypothetical protein